MCGVEGVREVQTEGFLLLVHGCSDGSVELPVLEDDSAFVVEAGFVFYLHILLAAPGHAAQEVRHYWALRYSTEQRSLRPQQQQVVLVPGLVVELPLRLLLQRLQSSMLLCLLQSPKDAFFPELRAVLAFRL